MKFWTSLNVSGAACLLAVGQLQAGHIEPSAVSTSAAPMIGQEMPVSSYGLDDIPFSSLISDSSYSAERPLSKSFGSDVPMQDGSSNATDAAERALSDIKSAPRIRSVLATTVAAPSLTQALVARRSPAISSFPFLFMSTSMIAAAFATAFKLMVDKLNTTRRLERTA